MSIKRLRQALAIAAIQLLAHGKAFVALSSTFRAHMCADTNYHVRPDKISCGSTAFMQSRKYFPRASTSCFSTGYRHPSLLLASSAAWSCSAELISSGAEHANEEMTISTNEQVEASPRLWMESLEEAEGVGGAYTVIRCELIRKEKTLDEHKWKIWGQPFHLVRLKISFWLNYQEYLQGNVGDEDFETAAKDTAILMTCVLDEAESMIPVAKIESDQSVTPVVMLTILWTSDNKAEDDEADSNILQRIKVRAHGSVTGVPKNLPDSIEVMVALPPVSAEGERDWNSLPRRYDNNPEAKDSSWCRERRPLEKKFKTNGIGEVLLAQESVQSCREDVGEGDVDGVELLEGLTSNLFAIYKDGTIRTAPSGSVLDGYARHIMIEAAERLGLQYDESKPVLLQDAIDGEWSEVFITSGIRLIIPVKSVAVPEYGKNDEYTVSRRIWSCDEHDTVDYSCVRRIYDEIQAE